MRLFFRTRLAFLSDTDTATTVAQIHDYAEHSLTLTSKRLLIFAAALVLQMLYISTAFATITVILIILAEVFDGRSLILARRAQADDPAQVRSLMHRLHVGAFFGACIVSFCAISLTAAPTDAAHFIPMFFLIAAAVFAAMNTHQVASVLVIRLAIYGTTFMLIPLLDLFKTGEVTTSSAWINLATSLFVLYFIIDCSMVGLQYYRTNSRQLTQLKLENRRAKEALAAKTAFLSTVSHELRTPLTSIRATLDMAMAGACGALPDQSSQVLGIAQRNAHRLAILIDELLDLQQMEVGKMKFDYCDVSLAELLADAVSDNRAYANELDVKLTLQPVQKDIYVRADPMRLEQVITNLLSNAAKFSDAGSEVIINVSVTSEQVRINVADHGVGIAVCDRSRIFNSFSQLDNTDSRKFSGTGLGLNISKQIVEAHGGVIDFEPNGTRGTIFFVKLARITAQGAAGGPRSAPQIVKAA